VLRHRLAGDRQLFGKRGSGAVTSDEQKVEHSTPGRIPDRRPEVVVDLLGHRSTHRGTFSVATYGASRGR
jgi:hypothetical protein